MSTHTCQGGWDHDCYCSIGRNHTGGEHEAAMRGRDVAQQTDGNPGGGGKTPMLRHGGNIITATFPIRPADGRQARTAIAEALVEYMPLAKLVGSVGKPMTNRVGMTYYQVAFQVVCDHDGGSVQGVKNCLDCGKYLDR